MLGKLLKANFRKDMSHMVSFLLIVILSSFMMQIGLMLVSGYNSQFERKVEELNSPDLMVYFATFDQEERDSIVDYISSLPEVDSRSFSDAVCLPFPKIGYRLFSDAVLRFHTFIVILLGRQYAQSHSLRMPSAPMFGSLLENKPSCIHLNIITAQAGDCIMGRDAYSPR